MNSEAVTGTRPVGEVQDQDGGSIGMWRVVIHDTLSQRRTQIGIVLTLFILFVAFVGPALAPHNPNQFIAPPYSPPSSNALLGTDNIGRDVLSRVLHGGVTVVWMSVAAASIGTLLGLFFALVAASSRSIVDDLMMRVMDVMMALPIIILTILFISVLGPKEWLVVLLVAIGHAPQVARTMRAVALEVMQRDFVRASEALGESRTRIVLSDVVPNIVTPLSVEYGLRIVWSVAAIAALSFLGYGIQPPTSDWGLMINENRTGLATQPWGVVAPMLAIGIFAYGVNLMVEGLGRAVARVDVHQGE